MPRKIFLDHNFTNEQYDQLIEQGYDINTPPDWLNPVNFLVRGTVAEPSYIQGQFDEAMSEGRIFVTTDHRIIEHVTKDIDTDIGEQEEIHKGVLVLNNEIYRSMSGDDINEVVNTLFSNEFVAGQVFHVDSKGVTDATGFTGLEGKEFVELKDKESLERYTKTLEEAEQNAPPEGEDIIEQSRDVEEPADSIREPFANNEPDMPAEEQTDTMDQSFEEDMLVEQESQETQQGAEQSI